MASSASSSSSTAGAVAGAPVVIRNRDMLALKAYITAKEKNGEQYDGLPSDMILLDLTHSNLVQQHIEIRFYLSDTVDTLRQRIYQKTGTPHVHQHLQIYRSGMQHQHSNNNSNHNNNDYDTILPNVSPTIKLGYYSLQHGDRVHCIDTNPHSGSRGGQYENVSLVEKYRMSDEEYNKRQGTLRDWERKERQKDATFTLQKHAIQHAALMEAKRCAKYNLPLPKGFTYEIHPDDPTRSAVVRVDDDDDEQKQQESNNNKNQTAKSTTAIDRDLELLYGKETVDGIVVGMRCEVQPGGRRGVVAYVGLIPELYAGYWIGVHFDEPVGKTDGTVTTTNHKNGEERKKCYFTAQPGFGGFVRGKNVSVGDYPERDLFDDDEEDEYDSQDEL